MRDWAGAIALVLATGVSVGFAGALVIAGLGDRAMTEHASTLVASLGGAMVGAVATYLGGVIRRRNGGEGTPPH